MRCTRLRTGDGVPQQLKDVVFPEVVVGFPPAAAPECGIDPLNTATSEDTTLAPCDSEKKTAGKKGGGKGRKKQTSAPTAAVPVCESSCPVCSCGESTAWTNKCCWMLPLPSQA